MDLVSGRREIGILEKTKTINCILPIRNPLRFFASPTRPIGLCILHLKPKGNQRNPRSAHLLRSCASASAFTQSIVASRCPRRRQHQCSPSEVSPTMASGPPFSFFSSRVREKLSRSSANRLLCELGRREALARVLPAPPVAAKLVVGHRVNVTNADSSYSLASRETPSLFFEFETRNCERRELEEILAEEGKFWKFPENRLIRGN
ncbi:hypothetical protein LR48_Vigan04g109000 [Vigna angularis]|uniref:Uncharacterized protein n=1 Tax=Phaseolus angularis TaxID=3914 RepID=A0A0L9UEC5_PHAAN|nr:hypothetical protein LR48_Vigan04g109000 [Vigna angularis]